MEKTRIELENVSQENEYLKETSKALSNQMETVNQEFYMLRVNLDF